MHFTICTCSIHDANYVINCHNVSCKTFKQRLCVTVGLGVCLTHWCMPAATIQAKKKRVRRICLRSYEKEETIKLHYCHSLLQFCTVYVSI